MKKILHLTHTNIETDARILKEMRVLYEAGYAVSAIGVILEEGAAKSSLDFDADVKNVSLISRNIYFFPKFIRHVISLIELGIKMVPFAIRQRPNVVHCHDTLVLPLGVIVSLITRAKLVYDAHELESNRNGLSKFHSKLTFLAEKFLWPFVDSLIVVSPSIQKWYLDNIGDKYSCVILNSPIYEEPTDSHDNYLRELFNIPKNRCIFIYVGILGQGRGLDLLINVFLDSRVNSHVVFLGFGEMSDQIKKITESNSRFHFHNAVPHSQVVPIIRSADFGLCLIENISLSDYYCLPNKLFEYCFAGVPVLASNFPDIKALVFDCDIGNCCDLNYESILVAIQKMETSGHNFKFRNLNAVSWNAQGQKLLKLYSQLHNH